MVTNETTIIIHRPVTTVFTYIADLQKGPQWQTGLLEVRQTDQSPIKVGTQFTSVRKFMGRKLETNVEVVTYELNSKLDIRSTSGPVPFEQWYFFEPTAEGTRLTSKIQLHTGGLFGLAEPLIAASANREMEAAFGDLKGLLESHAYEPAA